MHLIIRLSASGRKKKSVFNLWDLFSGFHYFRWVLVLEDNTGFNYSQKNLLSFLETLKCNVIETAGKGSWSSESQLCSRVPKSLADFPDVPDCKLRLLVPSVRRTWHAFLQPTNVRFECPIAWTVCLSYMSCIYRLYCTCSLYKWDFCRAQNVLKEVFWQDETSHSSTRDRRFYKVLFETANFKDAKHFLNVIAEA